MTEPATFDTIRAKIKGHETLIRHLQRQLVHVRRHIHHPCPCTVGSHPLHDFTLVRTHWYVEPHGCTGGDYWVEGEWRLQCPRAEYELRLFWNDDWIPYEHRRKAAYSGEEQFKRDYRTDVFHRSIERNDGVAGWWDHQNRISYYIDRNRPLFGLPTVDELKNQLRCAVVP